jgi:hypothetical protein
VSARVGRTGAEQLAAKAEESKFFWTKIVTNVLAAWVLSPFTSLELDGDYYHVKVTVFRQEPSAPAQRRCNAPLRVRS